MNSEQWRTWQRNLNHECDLATRKERQAWIGMLIAFLVSGFGWWGIVAAVLHFWK